jgi:hypothetical protein
LYVDAKSVERNEAYGSFSAACYASAERIAAAIRAGVGPMYSSSGGL